jgi:hypothetical protein
MLTVLFIWFVVSVIVGLGVGPLLAGSWRRPVPVRLSS